MRRFLYLTFLACFSLAPPLFGQAKSGPFTINASTSPCATIGVTGMSTVSIDVSGTFSATLQPEVALSGGTAGNTQVTPSTSTTKQSTITAVGKYTAAVGSWDTFLVCVTSYSSGTATIRLTASQALNASQFNSGGGSGTVTTTGSPAANQVATFSGASSITGTVGFTFSGGIFTVGQASATNQVRITNISGFQAILTPGILSQSTTFQFPSTTVSGTVTLMVTGGTPVAHAPVIALDGANAYKTTAALTNGQVLIGSTGADPVPALIGTTAPLGQTTGAGTFGLTCTGCAVTLASGATALGTSSIPAATCATVVTATATGTLTTSRIIFTPNASLNAVTGYGAAGTLTIAAYPTANAVNFDVCNHDPSNAVTPGAVTVNWLVQ